METEELKLEVVEDPCMVCSLVESQVGCHGVREGAVWSENYCIDCYNAK